MRRFGERDLRLPPSLREEMREPAGAIVQTGGLAKAVSGSRFVASVGDVCTGALLSLGIVPKVCVVDGKTKRGPWKAGDTQHGLSIVRVRNPAETITIELWRAVDAAYRAPGNTMIVVDGEEDLASLACIHLAPEGTTVIYGVPNKGVMVIKVDAAIRARTEGVLTKME
jgi:uncharacterized protein (UPF0218 family)